MSTSGRFTIEVETTFSYLIIFVEFVSGGGLSENEEDTTTKVWWQCGRVIKYTHTHIDIYKHTQWERLDDSSF